MAITINDKGVMAGLDKLLAVLDRAQDDGLDAGAGLLQAVDSSTTAYLGMSGATRDSTLWAPMDADYAGKAATAYAASVAALSGFTGHSGKPLSQDSGVTLAPGEKGIQGTNFTDYAADLEVDNAGEKAHLEPTLATENQEVTRIVANYSKQALR